MVMMVMMVMVVMVMAEDVDDLLLLSPDYCDDGANEGLQRNIIIIITSFCKSFCKNISGSVCLFVASLIRMVVTSKN